MKPINRRAAGTPAGKGGEFAPIEHAAPTLTLASAPERDPYMTALSPASSPRMKTEAARGAIQDCEYSFDEIETEDEQDAVRQLMTDDLKVLDAITEVGGLNRDQQPFFGKFLAEQLLENENRNTAGYFREIYYDGKLLHAPETRANLRAAA